MFHIIVTFGLFEYASAHQIQWQDSQPNDGGHLVVEVELIFFIKNLTSLICIYACNHIQRRLKYNRSPLNVNSDIYKFDVGTMLHGFEPNVKNPASAPLKSITNAKGFLWRTTEVLVSGFNNDDSVLIL